MVLICFNSYIVISISNFVQVYAARFSCQYLLRVTSATDSAFFIIPTITIPTLFSEAHLIFNRFFDFYNIDVKPVTYVNLSLTIIPQ